MKLHANASLTIKLRREIKELYESGQGVKSLAAHYGVHETTIRRWIKRASPLDRSSAPTRIVVWSRQPIAKRSLPTVKPIQLPDRSVSHKRCRSTTRKRIVALYCGFCRAQVSHSRGEKKKTKPTFEQRIKAHGLLHTLIAKGSPWRNGFIEGSNRTDNDEFFHCYRFTSSEERRYYFRLWEDYYKHVRPHQALHNQTPAHRFAADYPFHAAHRYLT